MATYMVPQILDQMAQKVMLMGLKVVKVEL
jgi:hypothetical protein